MGRRYLPLSSRCFCRLIKFFRLRSCRFDSFGMLVLLLVKCLPRMSFMTSIIKLGVSKMQCFEIWDETWNKNLKSWRHGWQQQNQKQIQIGPFLSLKWRIYKYVRVRAVRFRFLNILIQRDSFYTQNFFWFSYFWKKILYKVIRFNVGQKQNQKPWIKYRNHLSECRV